MAKESPPETISEQLRMAVELRLKRKRMTADQLADQAGIDPSQISRLRKGKNLTLPAVDALCRALGLRLCRRRQR